MATSSHPNSSSIPYIPRVVLNPTPISFAPPNTEAYMGPENSIPSVPVGKTDGTKKSNKSKKPKSNEASPAASTESKKAKKQRTDEESPSVSSEFKRPDWLPEGWKIIEHIREGGKTKGSKDKYYIEPGTGKRFRSQVEVRRHLGLDEPNEKNSSPKTKSSDVSLSGKKESNKRKADGEAAANGKENKKSKIQNGEING